MRKFIIVLYSLLLSCGTGSNSIDLIGVDEAWYPLNFMGREAAVGAFSDELLKEIGKIQKIQISKVSRNWDNLLPGLQEGKYGAILSSIQPYLFYEKLYDFSDLFLETGPVLVVRADSSLKNLNMLAGKEVSVQGGTPGAMLLEKTPGALIRYYDSIPRALTDLYEEVIDAAIVDVLAAQAYCNDLYQGKLKIATLPLTSEGLRLVVLHGKHPELLEDFNEGLKKLKSKGMYQKIAQKWGLVEATH